MRLGRALAAFWRTLTDADYAARLPGAQPELPAPSASPEAPQPAPTPAGPACDGLALLALLQRDARLVDFVMEPIDAYDDAQIGAAVRQVHAGCHQVLTQYLTIEPVLEGEEGAKVTVPAGFDPSAIQLGGKVSGEPPFDGKLAHHGWRAAKVELPQRPKGQDPSVLAAAEVDV